MTTTLIPAELLPANFTQEILSGGNLLIRCSCSGRWVGEDSDRIVIKHTRSCDFKASKVERPSAVVVAEKPAKVAVEGAATDREIIRAAKGGYAAKVATTDDLVELVNCGRLSMSAAMNQDM